MYDNLGMIMAFVIPIGGLALLVFAIAAIIEGRSSTNKAAMVKNIYMYLASLVALTLVVASGMFLIRQGLAEWVFKNADTSISQQNTPPPILYLTDFGKPQSDVAPTAGAITCTDTCNITESQRSQIANWEASYASWRDVFTNPGSKKARDAVAALSFLIIALPLFLLHFRIVQKEAKKNTHETRPLIRPAYFYYVAMASLLMMVIAGGFLVNLVLKTWVFPAAGKADDATIAYQTMPISISESDQTGVKSLIACSDKCQLSATTIASAQQWILDYAEYQKQPIKQTNNRQKQAADTIPFVLAGIPLFWYHWRISRKEFSSADPLISGSQ